MRVLEKTLVVLSLMAFVMDYLRMQGAGLLLLILLGLLGALYLLGAFRLFRPASTIPKLSHIWVLYLGSGLLMTILLAGIFLRWQHWGLYHYLLWAPLLPMIGLFLWFGKGHQKSSLLPVLQRFVPLAAVALLLLAIGDFRLLEWQYSEHPRYIEAYQSFRAQPQEELYRKQLYLERQRMVLPPETFETYFGTQADSIDSILQHHP